MHRPEKYIQKHFLKTIGWVILDCGMKIVYMYCWKKLCTAICRKLSENCICKYALCPGNEVLKKLILSAYFSMLPILINVSKLFFLHNIAPRMNGILENLHLENSINLCIWEKSISLYLYSVVWTEIMQMNCLWAIQSNTKYKIQRLKWLLPNTWYLVY